MKPKLLDLFCSAGGAGMGYSRAGFDVVGVDIKPQPRYPFEFHQADALEYLQQHWQEFDVIHASPPCQEYSVLASLKSHTFPMLIEPVRDLLIATGKPYIIENVPGAPLLNPLLLCGTMFGLRVIRHRYFENNMNIHFAPFGCNHWGKTQPRNDKRGISKTASLSKHSFLTVTGHDFTNSDGSKAMGIDWMSNKELAEAIPPAYTQWLGAQARTCLTKHAPDKWESVPSTGIFPPSRLSTSQSESTPPTCG
jgi:DNA (cytosine-5)-methyltransferase 1